MIIDPHRLIRWIGGAVLSLGVWFAALIALTIAAEPTRAVVVFAPSHGAMMTAVASADVTLLNGSVRMLNVAGSSPGFVARLYASGAWLVLPARTGGCVTAPPRAAAQSPARG